MPFANWSFVAFDPSDFAPEEEGHPDEVSIPTPMTETSAPPQVQSRPPVNGNVRPNQPPLNNAVSSPKFLEEDKDTLVHPEADDSTTAPNPAIPVAK